MRTLVYIAIAALMVLIFVATNHSPDYRRSEMMLQGGALVGLGIALALLVTDLTNGWSGGIDVLVRIVGFTCAALIAAEGVYTARWYDPETFKHPAFGTLVPQQIRPKP